jgi:hypothetical protein
VSRFRISPVWIVSSLALFFALGGSAFALTTKAAPQARCAQGAVRGIASVIGPPNKSIGDLTGSFTTSASVFALRFNCGGGAISVRRLDRGVYQVLFAGNPARNPVVTANSDDGASASVTQQSNHAFQVTTWANQGASRAPGPEDVPFTIVVF